MNTITIYAELAIEQYAAKARRELAALAEAMKRSIGQRHRRRIERGKP